MLSVTRENNFSCFSSYKQQKTCISSIQVNSIVRKHLKYATINVTIFCGNRQHATDAPGNALVSNNPKYSFSENFKGNKDGCPFKRVDVMSHG